jgi:hypothetical protein
VNSIVQFYQQSLQVKDVLVLKMSHASCDFFIVKKSETLFWQTRVAMKIFLICPHFFFTNNMFHCCDPPVCEFLNFSSEVNLQKGFVCYQDLKSKANAELGRYEMISL